jgi:ferredoxin
MAEGVAVVDRQRCIGCGLCVTGCPNDVARLQRRPDAEAVVPPLDFAAWERERLVHRGMAP